jgi:hypothetical protein
LRGETYVATLLVAVSGVGSGRVIVLLRKESCIGNPFFCCATAARAGAAVTVESVRRKD